MLLSKPKPTSLRVEITDGDPDITPREMQAYLWLGKGWTEDRMAQDTLETLARISPRHSLRMADVCAQQGAPELAYYLNNFYCQRARDEASFGTLEGRLRASLNAALLKGGTKSTARNELCKVALSPAISTNPERARKELSEAMTYLELALKDKPQLVLSYLLVLARCGLLTPDYRRQAVGLLTRLQEVVESRGQMEELGDQLCELKRLINTKEKLNAASTNSARPVRKRLLFIRPPQYDASIIEEH